MANAEELLREITACLDEALRLQSTAIDLTDRVHEAAGLTADRPLRGKVTGLLYGLIAHLEELRRLVREEV